MRGNSISRSRCSSISSWRFPQRKLFASDDFADALDYATVVKRVQAFAADHPHKLLERFAEALAELLRVEFGSPWVNVSVAKLAPVPASSGSASVDRAAARSRSRMSGTLPGTAASSARMVPRVQLLQPLARDVRIDRRRRDVGMPEQELHDAQIRAVIEQVGRERMPQGVRRQVRRRDRRP